VRAFAKSRRLFAKTDRLDARLLADFAAALTPQPTHAPDAVREQLRELHTRRAQLVAVRADELKRQEQPGLGKVATALLATLPELGSVSRQRIASLAGLAPFVYQSGNFKGQVHIRGGRLAVRQALYMAALSAMRCNPVLKPFAQRLTARGKPFHVVITAVMRKLLIHLNADLHRHPLAPPKTAK
jgi:transposase